jgi:hypothetical protein
MGDGGGGLRGVRVFFRVLTAGHGLYIVPARGPGDLAASRGAPGNPTRVAGRPGSYQSHAGSTGHLCWLTRPSPKQPKDVFF